MNSYERYWQNITTNTAVSNCSSATSALISASNSEDDEVKTRFYLHALNKIEEARKKILTELEELG